MLAAHPVVNTTARNVAGTTIALFMACTVHLASSFSTGSVDATCAALIVSIMSYFRHAPLALWAVVIAVLAGLGAIGWVAASSGSAPAEQLAGVVQPARPDVQLLMAEAAGVHSAALAGRSQEWARNYASRVAAVKEQIAAADPDDPSLLLWDDLETASQKLAAYRGKDRVVTQALASEIGVAAGALAATARLR